MGALSRAVRNGTQGARHADALTIGRKTDGEGENGLIVRAPPR